MKKYGSLIALAVVAVLAVVYFATREEPVTTVKPPYKIAKVDNLERIELTRPGDELVVMEKGESGWKLTKPVDAELDERVAKEVEEAFAESIGTDDLQVAQDKPADFELDEDKAVKVALYTQGASAPSAEFHIGKNISVPGTRAERTFIKTADGKTYRAHTKIGDVLRRDLDKLRSKKVQQVERGAIKQIEVVYADGTRIDLKYDDERDWVIVEPQYGGKLEKSQVNQLLSNLSNLTATGFSDGANLAELGLEPPHATVNVRADKTHKLLVSPEKDGKYYAKKANSPHVYELSKSSGDALTPTLASLRTRLVNDIPKESVTRMEFAGADKVVVEKKNDEWTFVRPHRGDKVKATAIDSKVGTFAQLRAQRFESPELAEAGLVKPAATVTLTADGKNHTLLIGEKADEKGNLWAKWKDSDLIMVVPGWVLERAETAASELKEDAS